MKKVKLKLKTKTKKIILAISLLIALVAEMAFLRYLVVSLMPKDDKKTDNILMSYTSKGDIGYNVVLKQNQFITEDEVEENGAYVTSLIDHITVTPSYFFNSSKNTNAKGTNKVTANLIVNYRDSNSRNSSRLLDKEYVLDSKEFTVEENAYSTSGSYDIYLNDYVAVLNDFQKEVKMAVDGYLEIKSETVFNGSQSKINYNNSYTNTLKIPLSSSVIQIDKATSTPKTGYVYTTDLAKSNSSVLTYIIVVAVLLFLIICILLRELFIATNTDEYEKALNRFLKVYDDIIVNTTNMANLEEYNLVEVEEFKEMLNLSRELLLPIIKYEYKRGKETWFYIIKEKILYRYILNKEKLEDLKNQKNKKGLPIIDNIKMQGMSTSLLIVLFGGIVFASVGFALFSDNIRVQGAATASATFDMDVISCTAGVDNALTSSKKTFFAENFTGFSTEGGFSSSSCNVSQDQKSLSMNVAFNNTEGGIYYVVKIKNNGTLDASWDMENGTEVTSHTVCKDGYGISNGAVVTGSDYVFDGLISSSECWDHTEYNTASMFSDPTQPHMMWIADSSDNLLSMETVMANNMGDSETILIVHPGEILYLIYTAGPSPDQPDIDHNSYTASENFDVKYIFNQTT